MSIKKFLVPSLFLVSLVSTKVLSADGEKTPVDLERAIPFSKSEGKFIPDENKSKDRSTPENVKQCFISVVGKVRADSLKRVDKSNAPLFEPQKFGPIFYLVGKDGFDIYFLKIDQYNNIMGLPFDDYYLVVFDHKTLKCSEKPFLIQRDFDDSYWDSLSNDGRDQLVIDNHWVNGTGHYYDKSYYEILSDLSTKEVLMLSGSVDGPHSSEEKIVQKKNGSVLIEETSSNSDIENSGTKTVKEVKLKF
jgi:hypothetical protein